jgi:hypothetical protein
VLVRDQVPLALKNENVTMCVCMMGVCMYGFCNVVMCDCSYVWVFWDLYGCLGSMCTCIDCVFLLFHLCIFILICY